jgi:uncharacterized protein with FMN-binding domain
MRRITVAIMGTLTGLVMLFSYHTSTNSGTAIANGDTPSTTDSGANPSTGSGSTPSPAASSADSSPSASASASPSSGSSSGTSRTYTGDAVMTQWGTVQVRITVQNGKITKSEAVQYPTENPRDQEINAYAVPALNQAVVQKQSGGIDAISGATVTSDGYIQSVQSAVDQANL